jgi:NTP pyrophosphatase (non-canonical NTP hydrolase)
MASVKENTTIKEYQDFVKEVYGLPNDRYFGLWDMISNLERFMMRGLKGIRKNDKKKTKINLLITFSWFMSVMNQLHIDIENQVWKRFPYLCSYCGSCPCSCKEEGIDKRQNIFIDDTKKPRTLKEFQDMFNEIYPAEKRTVEHAGVHLAEEAGEFSESLLTYRGGHKDEDFNNLEMEAADFFSCIMSVFNSLGVNMAKELSVIFSNNCHICNKAPCVCNFKDITSFKS